MRHLLRHARSHSSRNRAIAGWGPAARRTCNFARDASMCSSRSFSFLNVSRNPSDYVRHDTKLTPWHCMSTPSRCCDSGPGPRWARRTNFSCVPFFSCSFLVSSTRASSQSDPEG
jgi:hypothetical protein